MNFETDNFNNLDGQPNTVTLTESNQQLGYSMPMDQ